MTDIERPCCASPEPAWYPATNEDGWKCLACGKELGFRPDLDQRCAYEKISGLLMELQEREFVYVSNGTEGDIVTENVLTAIRDAGTYDQYSILKAILDEPNIGTERHAEFWHKRAETWLKERQEAKP